MTTVVPQDMLAPDVVPNGRSIQFEEQVTTAVLTGTTLVPFDDTIPQNTEGDEYLSITFTPREASSDLRVVVTLAVSNSVAGHLTAAVFEGSAESAVGAAVHRNSGSNDLVTVTFQLILAAASTTARTYKVRCGSDNAGTTTVNGVSGARKLGGVLTSSISVTEIQR